MTIEINENGSEAFYKETVNAAAQYAYILKNQSRLFAEGLFQTVQ